MRTRASIGVAILALAALGFSSIASAGAKFDRASGGGQILEDGQLNGAGDTIAFTAHGDTAQSGAATGNVTYIDRVVENGQGTGKGQTVRHGEVTCLVITPAGNGPDNQAGTDDDTAEFATINGVWRGGSADAPFEIVVTDNGEGVDAEDLIAVSVADDEPGCGDEGDGEENETPQVALGRGNVQVYNAP